MYRLEILIVGRETIGTYKVEICDDCKSVVNSGAGKTVTYVWSPDYANSLGRWHIW